MDWDLTRYYLASIRESSESSSRRRTPCIALFVQLFSACNLDTEQFHLISLRCNLCFLPHTQIAQLLTHLVLAQSTYTPHGVDRPLQKTPSSACDIPPLEFKGSMDETKPETRLKEKEAREGMVGGEAVASSEASQLRWYWSKGPSSAATTVVRDQTQRHSKVACGL